MDQPSGSLASTDVTEQQSPTLPVISPPPGTPPMVVASSRTSQTNDGLPRVDALLPKKADQTGTGFWWSHADQFMLAFLATVVLILLAAYWVRASKWNTAPIEIEHLDHQTIEFKIDINSATWVEWNQLDGIGDSLARRIVDDREQNGPFQSVDDLRRVKGIGPKTLERLRPWLTIDQTPEKQAP